MNSRIQKLISSENLTPSRFAEIIGVQRSSISHILSGRNKPSYDLIHSILTKFPSISPDWLILGNGGIYRRMVQASLFDAPSLQGAEIDSTLDAQSPDDTSKVPENNVDTNRIEPPKAPENPISAKSIERVLLFFNDKTFTEYSPG